MENKNHSTLINAVIPSVLVVGVINTGQIKDKLKIREENLEYEIQ
jgi:hypothetical protein